MKLKENIGINPEYWGGKKQSEFVQYFKDKLPKDKLVEKYKECVKIAKSKGRKPKTDIQD